MALTQDDAVALIYAALRDINAERGGGATVPLSPDTKLIGSGRDLDSLEIVNLIVGIETRLADEHGQAVILVNEDAFGGGQVFRTVESLANHIVRLTQG